MKNDTVETRTVLEYLSALGIQFHVETLVVGGSHSIYIGVEDVVKYTENPTLFIANYWGVTVENYKQWQAEEFSVHCAAFTKRKKRCKNVVTGGTSVFPNVWAEMQGDYCEVHSDAHST